MRRTGELVDALAAACEVLQCLPLDDLPRFASIQVRDQFGAPLGVRLQLGGTSDQADALIAWAEVLPGAAITAHWSCEPKINQRPIGITIVGELDSVPVEVWTYLDRSDVGDLDEAGRLLGLDADRPSVESVPVSLIALSMLRRPAEAVAS